MEVYNDTLPEVRSLSEPGKKKPKQTVPRFGWAKFPGLPYWPVKVIKKETVPQGDVYQVYVDSDNALLKVKYRDFSAFCESDFNTKKDEGIAALKRRKKYHDLEAFINDTSWMLEELKYDDPTLPQDESTPQDDPTLPQDHPTLLRDCPTLPQDDPTQQEDAPKLPQDDLSLQQDDSTLQQNDPTQLQDDPTLQQDDPTLQQDDPTLQQDDPTLQQDDPSQLQDDSTLQQDDPTLLQDDISLQRDDPIMSQDHSILLQDDPTLLQDDPTLLQDDPTLQQDDHTLLQDDSNLQQNDPTLQQNDPTLQQDDSTQQQDDSTQQQDDPTLLQDDSTLQQDDSTLQQDDPTLQQDDPTLLQDDPTLQQDDPTLQQDDPTLQQDDSNLQQNDPTLQQNDPTLQQNDPTLQQDDPTQLQDDSTLQQDDSTQLQDDSTLPQDDPTLQQDDPTLQQDDSTLQQDDPTQQRNILTLQQDDPTLQQDDPTLQQDFATLLQFDLTLQRVSPTLQQTDGSASVQSENLPLQQTDNNSSTQSVKHSNDPTDSYTSMQLDDGLQSPTEDLAPQHVDDSSLMKSESLKKDSNQNLMTDSVSSEEFVPDSCSDDGGSIIFGFAEKPFIASKLKDKTMDDAEGWDIISDDGFPTVDKWDVPSDDSDRDPDFIPKSSDLTDSDSEEEQEESLEDIVNSVIDDTCGPDKEAEATLTLKKGSENIFSGDVQEPNISSSSDLEKPILRYLDKEHKLRDAKFPNIYVKQYIPSNDGKTGEKKSTRPNDTVHACKYCFKLRTHIQDHLEKHSEEDDVKKILKMKKDLKCNPDNTDLKEEIKKSQDLLRQEGDHIHNRKVCFHQEGELLVQRKGAKNEFQHERYGPCPDCFMWLRIDTTLQKHQVTCTFSKRKQFGKYKKCVNVQLSKSLSGKRQDESSLVKKMVLPTMRNDKMFEIVKNDRLILELGQIWYIKTYDNKLKRCKTASFRMRLVARLLNEVRTQTKMSELDMLEMIRPQFFEAIVKATLALCRCDDSFNLKTPSVGLKIGYDLGRLAGLKICHSIKLGDENSEKEARDFLEIMKINWSVSVSKFAHTAVKEKHYNNHRELPHPKDIQTVAERLVELEVNFDLSSKDKYHEVVQVVLPRLMVYNRRRSGEIEALTVESYRKKTIKVDDVEEALLGDLSDLEKHLLESQQLMWIRGKQGKRVPVLIPNDAQECLEYINDEEVRRRGGVKEGSPYLFANRGHGVHSALQCLRHCCEDESVELVHPERLTSTGYRAYMATIAQCVALKNHEVQWLCNHLGHTEEVHKTHYRHTLEGVERIKLGKLLLMQDKNMVSKFHGKSLEEIEFSDIVNEIDTSDKQGPPPMTEQSVQMDENEGVKKAQSTRQMWTETEEKELKKYFASNLSDRRCPNTKELKEAVKLSKSGNGQIYLRKTDTIKKKVSNMIQKLRKTDKL